MRGLFLQNLVDDRSESVMSYYEFLVHIQKQISKWAYFLVTVDSENVKTETQDKIPQKAEEFGKFREN